MFLTSVALLGGAVRAWHSREGVPTLASSNESGSVNGEVESVGDQLLAVDNARTQRRSGKAKSRVTTSVIIDVDVANAAELEKLPRIGPSLAHRIVANRDSLGAFGSIEAFGRVRGIGPALQLLLEPLVTFSGTPPAATRSDSTAVSRKRGASARRARPRK